MMTTSNVQTSEAAQINHEAVIRQMKKTRDNQKCDCFASNWKNK